MIVWIMVGMLLVAVIWLIADVLQGLRAIDRKERYTPLPIEVWREFALSLDEPERTQMFALLYEGRYPLGAVMRCTEWLHHRAEWLRELRRTEKLNVPSEPGVYIVRVRGACKIGRASDVRGRLWGIQTCNPEPLEIIHIIWTEQAADVEQQLHQRYAHKRLAREWFILTDDDLAIIRRMSSVSGHQ